MGSTSRHRGEKASYYSQMCVETEEMEGMEVEGNYQAESSFAFLSRLRGDTLGL